MTPVRASIDELQVDGLRALSVSGEAVRLVILPDIGAKTISCVDPRTGHEYVWRNPDPNVRFTRPEYAAPFDQYDISGWDECFPGIGASPYPDPPWQGTMVPDHGELWTLPWRAEPTDGGLRLWVQGVRFPYTFEKRIAVTTDGFTLTYRVQNPTTFPFKCFWSTHPLFAATASTRVLLPHNVRVRVELSMTGRLGPLLSEHPWPRAVDRSGAEVDLSLMGPADQAQAEKVYTTPVPEGWAALHDVESDQWLAFTFDPAEVPLVGFWANRGAWPPDRPCFNLALEPCSGCPDRLDLAVLRGEYQTVPPEGELTWRLAVHLGRGRQTLERIVGPNAG